MADGMNQVSGVRAIVCDTGGTVFDWHTAVADALADQGGRRGIVADWPAVTKTWRRLSTRMVDRGLPKDAGRITMDMDDVLSVTLDETLVSHDVHGFSDEDRRALVHSWRSMPAWPDILPGVAALRTAYPVAPFTILKAALVVEASRRSGVSWDAVISCEMIGEYKTHPATYHTAARWLDVPIESLLLVTTHNNDLDAGHALGLRTAFVYRPDEWADEASDDPEPSPNADLVASDFVDLARQLGCVTGR